MAVRLRAVNSRRDALCIGDAPPSDAFLSEPEYRDRPGCIGVLLIPPDNCPAYDRSCRPQPHPRRRLCG
jgi:hypothetical protein